MREPHFLWLTQEDNELFLNTQVHLHYTSHTFQGNHESLQWSLRAHVNNFFSTLVKCVDFSDLSVATVGWFISFSKSITQS